VALRNSMLIAVVLFLVALWAFLGPLGNHGLWLAMTLFMLVRSLLLAWQYPRLERLADGPADGRFRL